jgi:hypothetical protein
MDSDAFVGEVLDGFAQALEPLELAIGGPEEFAAFVAKLGWPVDPGLSAPHLQATFGRLSQDLAALSQAVQAFRSLPPQADAPAIAAAVEKMGTAIASVATDTAALAGTTTTGLPPPLDDAKFWDSLAEELLGLLLYEYLKNHRPALFGILRFLGVAGADLNEATGQRSAYTRQSIDWAKLMSAATHPKHVFADVYGWGVTFDHARFIDNALALLRGFGAPAFPALPASELLDLYYDPTGSIRKTVVELHAPLYWGLVDSGGTTAAVEFSLVMLPIPNSGETTGEPVGILLAPQLTAQAAEKIPLGASTDLELKGSFGSVGAVRIEIRPAGTSVLTGGLGGTTRLSASAKLAAHPTPPWRLLGSPGSTRVELDAAHAAIGIADPAGALEVTVEAAIDSGRLVLDFGEGDGFIQKIFGGQPQTFAFEVGGLWSNRSGFAFNGHGRLEATLPLHQSILGVVEVDSISISIGAAAGQSPGLELVLAMTGGVHLGPIQAVVARVGLRATASTPAAGTRGNLGELELAFAFKPPDSLGLAIDATVVTGGGYIACHPDQHEYDGILQLQLETIGITAIGLLNTVMPDGSKGFSLLLILIGRFEDAPIELGFGFELTGAGGIFGVDRTMVVDVLRSGVRNGTVGSIMFPDAPVKNGPKIISDLRSVFPPQEGHYVFGPMLELVWGVPPLIVAELGVILELPPPIRVVILGRITSVLPDEEMALVKIHMDSLGVLDFEKKSASVDATLYDSQIVQYALSGEMAFRLNWGEQPNFVLAIGGLDSRYQPPPGFPSLRRLTLSMGVGENPRLSLDSYLAVTSNSVQFGAHVSVYAAEAGFAIKGALGFDALFEMSPFSMIAEMQGSVELMQGTNTLMSVHLELTLSGPSPSWYAHGSASAHILFLHPSVNIDKRWGESKSPGLPQINAETPFLAALKDPGNWSASPPSGTELAVSLGGLPAGAGTVLVHPLGRLSVRQKVVPLEVTISRFGSGAVAGPTFFRLAAVSLNGQPASQIAPLQDEFAMGQFLALSEDEKLSRPSFEEQRSGVAIGSSAATVGHRSSLGVQYETFVIDDEDNSNLQGTLYRLSPEAMVAARHVGAGALSHVLSSGRSKYLEPGTTSPIVVGPAPHVIADIDSLGPRYDIAAAGSLTGTIQALSTHLAQHPEDRGRLQVVFAHEAAP